MRWSECRVAWLAVAVLACVWGGALAPSQGWAGSASATTSQVTGATTTTTTTETTPATTTDTTPATTTQTTSTQTTPATVTQTVSVPARPVTVVEKQGDGGAAVLWLAGFALLGAACGAAGAFVVARRRAARNRPERRPPAPRVDRDEAGGAEGQAAAPPAPVAGGTSSDPAPERDDVPRLPRAPTGSSLSTVFGDHGGYTVVGASLLGADHAFTARSDEDAFAYGPVGGGVALAIADGASSSAHAALASRLAVSAAIRAFRTQRGKERARPLDALQAGVRAVHQEAARRGDSLDEWATTLAVALISRAEGRPHADVASVGNTHLYVLDGIRLDDLGQPGATFVSWPADRMKITEYRCSLEGDQGLLMATDGIGVDLDRSAALRTWFGEQIVSVDSPVAAADLLTYRRQGSADDRTYVCVRPT